jgi:hypothetical protein
MILGGFHIIERGSHSRVDTDMSATPLVCFHVIATTIHQSKHDPKVSGVKKKQVARDIHGILVIHEIGQYVQIWRLLEEMTLSTEPIKLVWIWTRNDNFPILLPSLLPGINGLQHMEAYLEDIDATASEILPLPCQFGLLLDCRPSRTPRDAAPLTVPSL